MFESVNGFARTLEKRPKGSRLCRMSPTAARLACRLSAAATRHSPPSLAAVSQCQLPAARDAVDEVIADTVVAYARLAKVGKEHLAYATPLVTFAAGSTRAGRRIGARRNIRDTMSDFCQRRKGIVVEHLNNFDHCAGEWHEIAVEDRRSGPAEVAAFRIDFNAWLQTLSLRDRRMAAVLATGESTAGAARMFAITPGRVSQLRKKLHDAWCAFTATEVAVSN